jgi:hypothetical protein
MMDSIVSPSNLLKILNEISNVYNIPIENIMNTLEEYNILPSMLKIKHSKTSIYKNPAVRLLSQKYEVSLTTFDNNKKLNIKNIRSYIKEHEEFERMQIFKKYLYLVMINKTNSTIGFTLAYNFLNNYS